MNISRFSKIAFCLAFIAATSACEKGGMRSYSKRPTGPVKPQQKIDECPAADGQWALAGSKVIELGRHEGFLKLDHPDFSQPIVFDGQSVRNTDLLKNKPVEITADCSGQIMSIIYKAEKTITESWNVDLEKDILGVVKKEDGQQSLTQGYRIYPK